jgi:hypothetical protein
MLSDFSTSLCPWCWQCVLQATFTANLCFCHFPSSTYQKCSCEFRSIDCRKSEAYGKHFTWQGHYPIGGNRIHLSLFFHWKKGLFLGVVKLHGELALLNCEAMSMVKLQANVDGIYCIFLLIYHNHSPVVSSFWCPECGSFLVVPKSFFPNYTMLIKL